MGLACVLGPVNGARPGLVWGHADAGTAGPVGPEKGQGCSSLTHRMEPEQQCEEWVSEGSRDPELTAAQSRRHRCSWQLC